MALITREDGFGVAGRLIGAGSAAATTRGAFATPSQIEGGLSTLSPRSGLPSTGALNAATLAFPNPVAPFKAFLMMMFFWNQ